MSLKRVFTIRDSCHTTGDNVIYLQPSAMKDGDVMKYHLLYFIPSEASDDTRTAMSLFVQSLWKDVESSLNTEIIEVERMASARVRSTLSYEMGNREGFNTTIEGDLALTDMTLKSNPPSSTRVDLEKQSEQNE